MKNYIDMKTFDDARKDSIKLWIKQARGSDESNGPYSMVRFELNCQFGRIRTLSFAKYDESGELTSNHEGGYGRLLLPKRLAKTCKMERVEEGSCGVDAHSYRRSKNSS